MDITLNEVKQIYAEIAKKHKGIETFHWGDFLDAVSGDEPVIYPLLVCTIQPAVMQSETVGINLMVSVWDKYNEDNHEQLDDVFSDLLSVCVDLKNILLSYRFEDYMQSNFTSNTQPFKHKGKDIVAGWQFSINHEIYDDANHCGIPIDDSFQFLERKKNYIPN